MTPEQNPIRHPPGPRSAALQLLVLSINFLGFAGIVLIIYGVAVFATGEKYKLLESSAEWVANVGTLVGVAFTAASVWFPVNTRPPEELSKRYAAPAVVLATAAVLLFYLFPSVLVWVASWFGLTGAQALPVHVFNGFSVLGLAGGLFRLISR
jgi:hypothetical protein